MVFSVRSGITYTGPVSRSSQTFFSAMRCIIASVSDRRADIMFTSMRWMTSLHTNETHQQHVTQQKKKTIRAAVRRHVFANAHADQTIKVRQTSSVCWFRFGKQSSMERMKQKVTGRAIFGVCARVALVCCCFVVSDFSFFLKTHQRRPR